MYFLHFQLSQNRPASSRQSIMQRWLDKESRKRAHLGSSAQSNYACTTQPTASHASAYTGNPHPSVPSLLRPAAAELPYAMFSQGPDRDLSDTLPYSTDAEPAGTAAVPFTCPVLPPPMTSMSLPVNANNIDEYSISFDNVIAYMQTYHPDPQVLDTLQMLRSTIRIRSPMIK